MTDVVAQIPGSDEKNVNPIHLGDFLDLHTDPNQLDSLSLSLSLFCQQIRML